MEQPGEEQGTRAREVREEKALLARIDLIARALIEARASAPVETSTLPNDSRADTLRVMLSLAVPMWIERVRALPEEERRAMASASAQVVAEKGDVIMFRDAKRGRTADAFNALARGLACLALMPGGVRFLGDTYKG